MQNHSSYKVFIVSKPDTSQLPQYTGKWNTHHPVRWLHFALGLWTFSPGHMTVHGRQRLCWIFWGSGCCVPYVLCGRLFPPEFASTILFCMGSDPPACRLIVVVVDVVACAFHIWRQRRRTAPAWVSVTHTACVHIASLFPQVSSCCVSGKPI